MTRPTSAARSSSRMAHGEDEHGCDACPEVNLFAVAKGVPGVGGAGATVHPEQNQHTVTIVKMGVNTL